MKNATIIIVAGGSASGKTTVASKIAKKLLKEKSVSFLSMDNYYKSFLDLTFEEKQKLNYDHPNSLDISLLCDHLDKLKNRISVEIPVYDFVSHSRSKKTIKIKPCDVIILDGLLALHIEEVRNRADIKIFIKAEDDIRIIRRIQRDISERKRKLHDIIEQYLSTVRPMHKTFVEPSIDYADIIIPFHVDNSIAVDLITTKITSLVKDN